MQWINFQQIMRISTEAGNVWCALGYTPIRDEQARVAGFLHTVINATASVEPPGEWRELTEFVTVVGSDIECP